MPRRLVGPGRGLLLLALILWAAGCGGGSASTTPIAAPFVTAFSPYASPIDFDTMVQNPTYTDGHLTVSTNASYPGKIVIFFVPDTELDPASVFVGGRAELGVDLSALQITRFIPGTGNVAIGLAEVQVERDRIVCTPAIMPLADGQYAIAVLDGVRSTAGDRLVGGPVYHSFTVGTTDTVSPFVIGSSPADGETGVGAGAPPPSVSDANGDLADIRTNIFGPTSPDVTVVFNEGIDASTVTLSNVTTVNSSWPPAAGPPPVIAPAPGFPKLKSVADGSTLPSNGHEILWRADPLTGGFPFGSIVEISLVGLYDSQENADADANGQNPDNPHPLADLAGNAMRVTHKIQFQTIAPKNLPQNPFPEYAIWWSASDRVGTIDTVNQPGLADLFTGAKTFPQGVPRNVIPQYTDTVATAQNIPGFSPTEISIDGRTNAATCHTWVYVISPNSGQLVVVNSRNSVPVAIIETPTPGGISNQTGGGQAANVVLTTNSSANTLTTFDFSNVTPGTTYLNGPIFVGNVQPTGNTPKAVSISVSPTGLWGRDTNLVGPPVPLILYADFTDGVVNTTRLHESGPVVQFNLGPNAAPNDVSMTPCWSTPTVPPILFGAISQGGLPGEGKVTYYVAGPNCSTGTSITSRPDDLVGSLTGFDGPAGLDEVFPMGNGAYFAVAESGATANRVRTLGVETGAANLPRVINTFDSVGDNPVAVAHRGSWWQTPIIAPATATPPSAPSCWYNNTQQYVYVNACYPLGMWDCSLAPAQELFICARGSSQVSVVNLVTGSRDYYSPIHIPGVHHVSGVPSQ